MKIESTEKMKYIMMELAKNILKLSSQIFDFRNFITEIFCHKVPDNVENIIIYRKRGKAITTM